MSSALNTVRACLAPKADGVTRCRNHAVTANGYCTEHTNSDKIAPPPDIILFKARVNPKWKKRLEQAGVRWQNRDDKALDERHAAMAIANGRKPRALREDRSDSGSQVFGADGAMQVSVEATLPELLDVGYTITDIHLYKKSSDDQMATVVVELSKGEIGTLELPKTSSDHPLWALIGNTSWKAAHVWANGEDQWGNVTHTVNLCHRTPDDDPECTLVFADGLWDLV